MMVFIKVKEAKDAPEMLVKVTNPVSLDVDVKDNSVKISLGSSTQLDIVDNNTNEHYDVIDVDFISYDADDELETFYIYDVIQVRMF